jgi:bacterioferritin (cytochrome b1)
MYIEDILHTLELVGKINRFDQGVVQSLNFQTHVNSSGYTEKQSLLAIKILRRYSTQLNTHLHLDITQYLDNPLFKIPLRNSAPSPKRISIEDHPQWVKAIKVEFPFNEDLVKRIRDLRSKDALVAWDKDKKAWFFSLHETNIKLALSLAEQENFEIDENFKVYKNQIAKIMEKMETFFPMLILEENTPKLVNISKYTPDLETADILEAVFAARKYGIDTWDDSINAFIQSDSVDPIVKKFITTDTTETFHIDSTSTSMNLLRDIVQYLEPVLFIVPGGSELSKTKMAYEFLKEQNVTDEEISVMFRLPSDNGGEFNSFVKSNNLNNPISEKTRFVFVSQKMPKPVITSKTYFNCVISMGLHNMHYTIRDFTKNCPNLIYYCEQRPNREINFGNV